MDVTIGQMALVRPRQATLLAFEPQRRFTWADDLWFPLRFRLLGLLLNTPSSHQIGYLGRNDSDRLATVGRFPAAIIVSPSG